MNKVVYVQDLLKEHSDLIGDFLVDKSTTVIICGRSFPMPMQVLNVFQEILIKDKGMNNSETVKLLNDMRKTKRFIFDTWG